jgi:Secretion system C-terminal sorting domain
MKKIFTICVATLLSMSAYSQDVQFQQAPFYGIYDATAETFDAARTMAHYDSVIMTNVASSDTATLYYAPTATGATDSGYLSGYSWLGFNGFAERYDFNGSDSSVQVLGVEALFGGTLSPFARDTVKFHLWQVGPQAATVHPHYFYSGLPDTAIDSSSIVPVSLLGVGVTHGAPDTLKAFPFLAASPYLTKSFFVGYTCYYKFSTLVSGDTIGLYTTKQGERTAAYYSVSGTDTIFNDKNASLKGGLWGDNALQLGQFSDYYIYPVVIVKKALGVNGITHNNLTFFGNYPNPATDVTNIRFSLSKNTDVTVVVTNISGQTVKTVMEKNLAAGEHRIALSAAELLAGDYIYVIRTAEMDGMASKFSVVK